MDNVKIGKLIAKLRRKKGLTQQELADKFGIGYRAVSKWERGLCLPDISIINELSKILDISSDELLKGEVDLDNKSKVNDNSMETKLTVKNNNLDDNNSANNKRKIIKIISISMFIVLCIFIFVGVKVYLYNKTYKYELISTSDEYIVDGYIELYKDNLTLVIDKLEFTDEEFLKTEIINYDYQIMIGDELLFGYGEKVDSKMIESFSNVFGFINNFSIHYSKKIEKMDMKKININFKIYISFQVNDDFVIKTEIDLITKLI